MPGVDFERIRAVVTMEAGAEPAGIRARESVGATMVRKLSPAGLRGRSRRRGSFSVNVASGRYCCHRCRSHGNALELWAAATQQSVHQAAIDLCRRLGCEIPWIRRW